MGIPTGFPTIAPFATSEFRTTTEYSGENLGQLYGDGSGNVYLLVDCQEAFIAGEVAVINENFQASQAGSASRGLIGIIQAAASASDTYAWAQVFGKSAEAWVTSGATTAGTLIIPVTSDGGYFGPGTSGIVNTVFGAFLRAAPTTAAEATGWTTGIVGQGTVQLVWPWVHGGVDIPTS